VLFGHAPFMTTLKEGRVKAYDGDETLVFDVRGGFADVTPAGLTILAEYAAPVI
jgi:F-type H+-transporting ATPase subunit epsilon